MAEQRVTQIPGQLSGTPTEAGARVTQVPGQLSGTPTEVGARVTQYVVQLSGQAGKPVYQTATFVDPDTFPAGGTVVLPTSGIPVTQVTTFVDPDTFPAGGTINNVVEITGTATIGSTASVFLNGTLTNPTALTGLATIGSTAAVNGGGRAAIGLYTITLPPNAILGLMDLAALQLSQVLDPVVTPVSVEGAFTYVFPSTASVFLGGAVYDGITLTGLITAPSGASVGTPGALTSLPLVGSVTVPSGASVPTPGDVELLTGIIVQGSFTVPSGVAVLLPGVVVLSGYILGTATVPSAASVFTGGTVGIGGAITAARPQSFTLSGHSHPTIISRAMNESDVELLKRSKPMKTLLKATIQSSLAAQVVSQGGLGSLSGRPPVCVPDRVNCHKVNLRKNLFERGKLLTPADGGAADHTVLEFSVPTGYFCSILAYYTIYTGTGFVQGSGDILWRLKVGNAWADNMGNLRYAMGSAAGTVTMGTAIELEGDDRVQFLVNVPNGSGLIQVGASYILCGVQGWLYPAGSWAGLEGR